MLIEKGMIVKSVAGHDQNRFYVVISTDGINARIADGKVRPLEKPKSKKAKHLAATTARVDAEAITTNRQLRQVLAAYNNGRREENIE